MSRKLCVRTYRPGFGAYTIWNNQTSKKTGKHLRPRLLCLYLSCRGGTSSHVNRLYLSPGSLPETGTHDPECIWCDKKYDGTREGQRTRHVGRRQDSRRRTHRRPSGQVSTIVVHVVPPHVRHLETPTSHPSGSNGRRRPEFWGGNGF